MIIIIWLLLLSTSWLCEFIIKYYDVLISGWWFGTWILFFIIYGRIIPTDFHIFQRGGYTTNQIIYIYILNIYIHTIIYHTFIFKYYDLLPSGNLT